jgi:hypothetical protein
MSAIPAGGARWLRPFRQHYLLDPWRDAFVLVLRLSDVSGAAIGDALAQVNSHCTESGQSPADAFGDPRAYATEVAASLKTSARTLPLPWWRVAIMGAGTLLGTSGFLAGLAGLTHDHRAPINFGTIATVPIVAIGALVVMNLLDRSAHSGARWPVGLAFSAFTVAIMLVLALWRQPAFTLPAGIAVALGVLLLIGTWLPQYGLLRTAARDHVIDPSTAQDFLRAPRWVYLLLWGFPALMLAAGIAAALLAPPKH